MHDVSDQNQQIVSQTPPTAVVYKRQLILLLVFRACRSIAAGMIALAFPYLVLRNYQLSSLMLGLIYTAATISTAVFGLLMGFLADVWGRKKTLWVVGIMLPVSSLIIWLMPSVAAAFIAAIVGGYSATGSLMGGGVGGAAMPIQTAVLASLTQSRERTWYFSVFTFWSGILSAAGALAVKLFTVQEVFVVATIISAAGMVFLLPLHIPEVKGTVRRVKSARTIGQFSLTGMLNGFSQGLITPFLIPFFVLVYHIHKNSMATYGFIAGALGSVALLTAPFLDRIFGFVRAIALTRGLGALIVLVLPFTRNLPLALAIYVLIPALRVAAIPAQQRALTDRVDPAETGRALGVNQVTRLGASSGAVTLTGYLFSEADYAFPFIAYAAIMAINIGLYFRFFGGSHNEVEAGE